MNTWKDRFSVVKKASSPPAHHSCSFSFRRSELRVCLSQEPCWCHYLSPFCMSHSFVCCCLFYFWERKKEYVRKQREGRENSKQDPGLKLNKPWDHVYVWWLSPIFQPTLSKPRSQHCFDCVTSHHLHLYTILPPHVPSLSPSKPKLRGASCDQSPAFLSLRCIQLAERQAIPLPLPPPVPKGLGEAGDTSRATPVGLALSPRPLTCVGPFRCPVVPLHFCGPWLSRAASYVSHLKLVIPPPPFFISWGHYVTDTLLLFSVSKPPHPRICSMCACCFFSALHWWNWNLPICAWDSTPSYLQKDISMSPPLSQAMACFLFPSAVLPLKC